MFDHIDEDFSKALEIISQRALEFQELFKDSCAMQESESIGRLADDDFNIWIIESIILERVLPFAEVTEHTGIEDIGNDELLGNSTRFNVLHHLKYGLDELKRKVASNRKKLGEWLAKCIKNNDHATILKCSRAIKSCTQKIRDNLDGASPSDAAIFIMEIDYIHNGKTTITKNELWIMLGEHGFELTDRQFRGLCERMKFDNKFCSD